MVAYEQLKQKQFKSMVQEGTEAYKRGNHRLAHDLWREAATLDPYNEQVWLALYRVLDNDSDRRVCLQNIIAINPLNVKARRQLHKLESKLLHEAQIARQMRLERRLQEKVRERSRLQRVRRENRTRLVMAILLGVAAAVLAIFIGIVGSILVYGF